MIAGGLGNWKEYLTLPNILKNFNPTLHGYSTQKRLFAVSAADGFNVAVSNADSDDLLAQAVRLVQRMRKDPKVNIDKDWKMVTLFSGHNDVCSHSCKSPQQFSDTKDVSPAAFTRNVQMALDYLQRKLPRTFVNLVPTAGKTRSYKKLMK
jgi:phospholipase B1